MAALEAVRTHHTRAVVAALLVFVALAALHTWPIAKAPSHWARVDNGDGALNIWAVNWVGTHLFRDPAHVADANIFYPERRALAFSEMMWVQGAIAAPAIALGAPPVFAFNVAVVAGFALTGFAFCVLVHRWTGSWGAGYVAGSLAAFNAHSLMRIAHLQTLHLEFFALTLFALDRLATANAFRHACLLGLGFALHAMTSIYLTVFAAWALVFAAVARAREMWRHGTTGVLRIAAAIIVAAVVIYPYASVYLELRSTGLARGADDVIAASWQDYLSTGARLHLGWSRPYLSAAASYSFPGVAALVLAAIALLSRPFRGDPRVRMCAIAAAGCVVVSFLGRMPFYPTLHDAIPMLQAVRVQSHLGQIVLIMIAVLAGFGVAALRTRLAPARWWPATAAALIVIVNAEALRAPVGYVWFDGVPKIYETLRAEPRAVVVEVPFPMPRQWFLNGPYMVNSTQHWHPILNGYSGFRPDSYERSYEAAREFPSDQSLIRLHELGVTHVVVHLAALGESKVADIARMSTLEQIASEGDIMIYRLRTR